MSNDNYQVIVNPNVFNSNGNARGKIKIDAQGLEECEEKMTFVKKLADAGEWKGWESSISYYKETVYEHELSICELILPKVICEPIDTLINAVFGTHFGQDISREVDRCIIQSFEKDGQGTSDAGDSAKEYLQNVEEQVQVHSTFDN